MCFNYFISVGMFVLKMIEEKEVPVDQGPGLKFHFTVPSLSLK